MTLYVSDRDELYTLNIRHGVLRIVAGQELSPDTAPPPRVELRSDDLVRFALRALKARDALDQERFITQDTQAVADFFSHLTE